MNGSPLISFVATSRNDDHGGDVLNRTQSFVRLLALQCRRHEIRCELLLVDWNPPAARAPLSHVLEWPQGDEWFEAEVITAPKALHRELRHSDSLHMFQMIAKNVGIRRANGRFIVATNIDIIFSDELFTWLKNIELKEGILYRSDRWDIPNEIQQVPDMDTLLRRARNEAFRKNLIEGTFVRGEGEEFRNSTPNAVDAYFIEPMSRKLERLSSNISRSDFDKDSAQDEVGNILEYVREQRRYYMLPRLHTNGCGDFTMLGRQTWAALRGYPEWQVFSWAIDSILIYQAYYNGIRIEQVPADAVHYHIEHGHGSGWSPEGAGSLWQRMEALAIPCLDEEDCKAIFFELEDNGAASAVTVYAGLDWGFDRHDLPIEKTAAPGMPAIAVRAVNQGPLVEYTMRDLYRTAIDLDTGVAADCCQSWSTSEIDGSRVGVLTTHKHPWGYALQWDLGAPLDGDETWVEVEYRVLSGRVGFAVVDAADSTYLAECASGPPASVFKRAGMRLPRPLEARKLVCRNLDLAEGSLEIRGVSVLRGSQTNQASATAGAWQGAMTTEPLGEGTEQRWRSVGDQVVCHAALGGGWVLAVPKGGCRIGLAAEDPLFVWTAADRAEAAAYIALPEGTGARAIRVDLSVIEGYPVLGLLNAEETGFILEQALEPGHRTQHVEFQIQEGSLGRIVVKGRPGAQDAHVQITGVWVAN